MPSTRRLPRATTATASPRPAGFYAWRDPARVSPQRRAELAAHDARFAEPGPERMSTRAQARLRDVPQSCTCRWEYRRRPARWALATGDPDCPWHTGRPA